MNTWKTKRKVCRSRKTGKFCYAGKCGMFKRTKVRATRSGTLFS